MGREVCVEVQTVSVRGTRFRDRRNSIQVLGDGI